MFFAGLGAGEVFLLAVEGLGVRPGEFGGELLAVFEALLFADEADVLDYGRLGTHQVEGDFVDRLAFLQSVEDGFAFEGKS